MKIGIIGAGRIGSTVGSLWVAAGHSVCFGSRDPGRLAALLAELGATATAASVVEAADFGEVLFAAVPYGAWPELAEQIGPTVAGKPLLDAANAFAGRVEADAGLAAARLVPPV